MRLLLLCILLLALSEVPAQNNPGAWAYYAKALADTTAHRDSMAVVNFYAAAKEELKATRPDSIFIAQTIFRAGITAQYKASMLNRALEFYLEALAMARLKENKRMIYDILYHLGEFYGNHGHTALFSFEPSDKETRMVHFPVVGIPDYSDSIKVRLNIGAGTNDGVYEGSEGKIWSIKNDRMPGREYQEIGHFITLEVNANSSIGEAQLYDRANIRSSVLKGDLVELPVRKDKKSSYDLLDDLAQLHITLIDNDLKYVVHPRMLLHNQSPALYTDIRQYLLKIVHDIWNIYKDRTGEPFTTVIKKGRFGGKTMLEAMRDTGPQDIEAFLGYMRTYTKGYFGEKVRFSERYAGWVISDAPTGGFEAIDSLAMYSANQSAFNDYVSRNAVDIIDPFYFMWIERIQTASANGQSAGMDWPPLLIQTAKALKNDSLLAWGYWITAYAKSGGTDHSAVISNYQKALELFRKINNREGLSYSLNNIGTALINQYKYKEAQPYFEETMMLRKKWILKDSTENRKIELASAITAVGNCLQNQGKNQEAVLKYLEAIDMLEKINSLSSRSKLSDAYTSLAKTYRDLGDYTLAATFYERQVLSLKSLGDQKGMAGAYDQQAYLLSLLGQNRQSLEAYRQAYLLHLNNKNKAQAGFSMSNMGQCFWSLGDYDSAIICHNQSIELRRAANDTTGEAYSWKMLGQLHRESGNPVQSLEDFKRSQKLYEETRDDKEKALLYNEIAASYKSLKDYRQAITYYEKALSDFKKINSAIDVGSTYHMLCAAHFADKHYALAEKYNDSAIVLQKQIGDRAGLIYSYQQKAYSQQYFQGDFKLATKLTREALTLARETTSESNIAFCFSSLAILFDNMGVYDSAKIYYRMAYDLYSKLEDRVRQADVLINLGYFYSGHIYYDSARVYFDQALEEGRKLNDKRLIANAYEGIAQLETGLGNFEKAFGLMKDVIHIWKEQQSPWALAGANISLGNIHNMVSEFSEAIACYQLADSLYKFVGMEKSRATAINNIGTIYFYQKEYALALPRYIECLGILNTFNDDPKFTSLVKANIGEVYVEMKNYEAGEKWLKEAIAIGKDIKNRDREFEPTLILARLKTAKGETAEAEKLLLQAANIIKTIGTKPSIIRLETEFGKLFLKKNDRGKCRIAFYHRC